MLPITQTQGLTLVELLVASSLATVIMLLILQLLSMQGRSVSFQAGIHDLHQRGQYGLQFMQDEVQRAGFNQQLANLPIAPIVSHLSHDARYYDQLTLQRRLSASGDRLCTGAAFSPNATLSESDAIVWSQYAVQEDGKRPGVYQLVCRYGFPGVIADPQTHTIDTQTTQTPMNMPIKGWGIVIDEIDSFQVLYGVRQRDGVAMHVEQYVPISQWQPDQQQVVAVHLAVLLKTPGHQRFVWPMPQSSATHFKVLDQVYATQLQPRWQDGHVRRVYELLIVLPNVPLRWVSVS